MGDGNGKTVGGFAVSGRTTTKEVEDILHITPENTQIYVGEGNGKTVGGFAVSGRTTTKEVEDILQITPENTQIYVGEGNGKTVGGFAVSGRTTTKGVEDILQITPDNTRIYVSESDGKTVGGFAVSGRTTTKEEGFYDVLKVVPERTDVFIKPPDNKLFPDGFSVSVYDEQLIPTELFNVSEEGIFMNNEVVIVPNVVTGDATELAQTSVSLEGTVLPYNGPPISHRGITYSISPNPIADIHSSPSGEMGTIIDYFPGDGFGEFDIYLYGLNPGTLYYYRAFAINQDGLTGYGAQKTFTTLDPYTVTFIVLEDGTDVPINNATITFNGTTNPPGDYEFFAAEGYSFYTIIAEGYLTTNGELYITSDMTLPVHLIPADYSVVFTVTNQHGNPVSNVEITMSSDGAFCSGTTNAYGIAICNPPEEGEYDYHVYIYTPGYEEHPGGTITISDPGIIYESITLNKLPVFTVTFHVLTPQGDPCVNAEITLMEGVKGNGEKWYYQTFYTDASGYATFEEVYQSAEYSYSVYHPNYEFYSGTLDVNEDMLVEVQLEIVTP
ncbi:MAG: Bacterial Ig-like domain (group 1) [Bacteroidetes bacterium ADurb.Bin008]|nr:MAG: Bacterial Ig-like domain (group 1) [Bacteroidetes bacterium ADurb.Bin008]